MALFYGIGKNSAELPNGLKFDGFVGFNRKIHNLNTVFLEQFY